MRRASVRKLTNGLGFIATMLWIGLVLMVTLAYFSSETVEDKKRVLDGINPLNIIAIEYRWIMFSLIFMYLYWALRRIIDGIKISFWGKQCRECGKRELETELIDEVYMGQEDTSFWLPREGGISNWKRVERTSPVTRKTFKASCNACGASYTYSEKSTD